MNVWYTILARRMLLARIFLVIWSAVHVGQLYARGAALETLLRKAAHVADDVPVRSLDDVAAEIAGSKAAREAVDADLRSAKAAGETGEASAGAARSEAMLKRLRATAGGTDAQLLKRIEELDAPAREAAVVLVRGGRNLAEAAPDLALRADLLRRGGADAVAAAGLHGADAARAMLKVDAAIESGAMVVAAGGRKVDLADFARAIRSPGGWEFWRTKIAPNWKVWATSGALAFYLVAPAACQDAAGGLTEYGSRELAKFSGVLVAGAVRGFGDGSAEAVERVAVAARETYWSGPKAVYAWIGTGVIGLAMVLAVAWRRRWKSA